MWSAQSGYDSGSKPPSSHRGWRATLALLVAGGFVVLTGTDENRGLALMLAGASLLIGGFLGFLFGIPKSLQLPVASVQAGTQVEGAGAAVLPHRYCANTNLEEVSDWLTKILVGVGLTQLTSLPTHAALFGQHFGPVFGGTAVAERLATTILVYFSVVGFLFTYLWTRLFLGGALAEADALSRVEQRLDAQQLQAQCDATALALVARHLQPGDAAPSDVQVDQLKDALQKASVGVKVQAFYQAESARRENWQQPSDKPLMERTIPIFEALTQSDTDKRFHRSWGQLGYALKDQRTPDWTRALSALSTAIRIRGDAAEYGYTLYEYNRVLCRINLDADFAAGQRSTDQVRNDIRADLKVIDRSLSDLVRRTPEIQSWLALNG